MILSLTLGSTPRPIGVIPTLSSIDIGGISIPMYPVMIGIGAIGMLVYTWTRRERFGLGRWQCVLFAALLTACGIAGAKLLYILENFQDVLNNRISGGGVSFFGSVYLVPLLMPLIGRLFGLAEKCKKRKVCYNKSVDETLMRKGGKNETCN